MHSHVQYLRRIFENGVVQPPDSCHFIAAMCQGNRTWASHIASHFGVWATKPPTQPPGSRRRNTARTKDDAFRAILDGNVFFIDIFFPFGSKIVASPTLLFFGLADLPVCL